MPAIPIRAPARLVVVDIDPPRAAGTTPAGGAYFLFMGGEGCATVNEWGEKTGGIQ